jgi:hypothetical protein
MAYSYQSWGDFQTFGAEGWAGERPVPAARIHLYERVEGAAQQALDVVYQRLRDDGWRTGAVTQQDSCSCHVFWASRDGLLLRVLSYAGVDGQSVVVIGAHRAEPDGVFAAAIAGFVAGLVLAWTMMTWLVHRFARTRSADRMLVLLFGLPVLVACVANTVDNVLSMVPDPDTSSVLLTADLMYPLANQAANPLAATVIALGLAACAAVTGLTPWQRRKVGSA